jgi:hypothetical protein
MMIDNATKSRPNPRKRQKQVFDLPQKLDFLLSKSGMSRDTLYDKLSTKGMKKDTGRDFAKLVDERTLGKCFDKEQYRTVENKSIKKICGFFSGHLRIDLETISGGFAQSTYEVFKRDVERLTTSKTDIITLKLASEAATFLPGDIEYLTGKYVLYRYSFSKLPRVVTEVVAISANKTNHAQFDVRMFCHPALEGQASEEFLGTMFRFGRLFLIIASFCHERDRRLRSLYFPLLGVPHKVHFGLATGYSAHFEEPASVKVIAHKIADDSRLTDEDKKLVTRVAPDDKSIPAAVRPLISNHLDGDPLLPEEKADHTSKDDNTRILKPSKLKIPTL